MTNKKMYCSKCGTEYEVDSSFCNQCGLDLRGASVKKPSKMWYLLPILLSIIGGIIGYFAIKGKDKKMAKNILYVGLVVFVLGIIFTAAVPSQPQPPVATVPSQPPVAVTPTSTSVSSYQDNEYLDWAIGTSYSLSLNMNLITISADSSDFEGVETYSGILNSDAKKALNEINQFDVSPALKPSKDEFKLALQDFEEAGYYGEKGARNYDSDDLIAASEYTSRATNHITRSTDLLPK